MAAATVLSDSAKYLFHRIFMRAIRGRKSDDKMRGAHMLHITAGTIPTTSLNDANDIWVLADFTDTPHLYLSGRGQITLPELDTGTNLLVWSLVLINAADTVVKTLISASTVGRAAGFDEFDADAGLVGYDAGLLRLAMKIGTAANVPVAGAVVVDMEVYFDRIEIGA
jgi:hypothetical protein